MYTLTSGGGVVRDADGAFVPADARNPDGGVYLAWLAAGNAPTPAPAMAPPGNLTAYDYLHRFTPSERAGLYAAATAQPPTSTSLALMDLLVLTASVGQVHLNDPATLAGHTSLVALGLLTAARSAAVLTP